MSHKDRHTYIDIFIIGLIVSRVQTAPFRIQGMAQKNLSSGGFEKKTDKQTHIHTSKEVITVKESRFSLIQMYY